MVRKKKETLVHLDLDTLSKEVSSKKISKDETSEQGTIGVVLKKAREKKKLSLAEISQKLHIRESFLDALETGHYYVFPGLAYGVGFLRTYAEFLGLDSKELIEQFHAETSGIKVQPIEMPIPQNYNLMPSFRTILMSVIALLIVYLMWYITMTLTNKVPEPEMIPVNLEETALPEANVVVPQQALPPLEDVPLTGLEAPIVADAIVPITTEVKMKETTKGAKKTPLAKVYGSAGPEGVSLLATEEVWIEVRDGDKVVLEEVLYPGDRYNAPSDSNNLILNTANAGALSVMVNGKPSRPLGNKGTLAEGISLDINSFN